MQEFHHPGAYKILRLHPSSSRNFN